MEFSSDVNLFEQLQSGDITPDTCDILKEEQILTPDIFFSLGQEHFAALSKRVKIGHVLLLKIWDKVINIESVTYDSWLNNFCRACVRVQQE